VYSAIPLASLLMCFRFLQVAWVFRKTGELPQHDHGHVDGVDEQIAIGEAFEAAEEIEHGAAGKTGGRK
jgi:C4-dicarboxylate transporter DctQ subunit